jgi:hypothetical protein
MKLTWPFRALRHNRNFTMYRNNHCEGLRKPKRNLLCNSSPTHYMVWTASSIMQWRGLYTWLPSTRSIWYVNTVNNLLYLRTRSWPLTSQLVGQEKCGYTRCSLWKLIRLLSTWCHAAEFFSASGAALSQEVPTVIWMSNQCALWTPDINPFPHSPSWHSVNKLRTATILPFTLFLLTRFFRICL